ncbi:hypothetical protein TNIN_239671 [Trichonephila inaurata madagascariensis]|uniref:Uncharacterized protein n=1 Tax=Trichonephila inaurata madagascariensis TaxID=2747483 RepID=A0A8X6YHU5_9ARAC|nr:hypothetical protein TNIN_239671 [Trichonephila inaurata madagascariensis]
MVVLRILETSLYLFFSVIADYIQVDLVSFLEILGCVLVFALIKNLTGIYFESTTQDQEWRVIAEREDGKLEGTEVPVVHSLMVFKMCKGLGLIAQLAAELDRKVWVAKKIPHPIPKVHSKTILRFCEALNLDAELAYCVRTSKRTSARKLIKVCEASFGS